MRPAVSSISTNLRDCSDETMGMVLDMLADMTEAVRSREVNSISIDLSRVVTDFIDHDRYVKHIVDNEPFDMYWEIR